MSMLRHVNLLIDCEKDLQNSQNQLSGMQNGVLGE